jgi:hypothetical protein
VFEDVVKPQFEAWAKKFIPDWQYGFIPGCGTVDYGAALTLKIQDCLERRKQGVLIATDIQGAFDQCWWARMKKRLKKKGLRRRALLRLIRSYLFKRFLKVVAQGKESSLKEIFSSVPQGGKWSSFLFDLDISELPDDLSAEVIPFGYADDVALWYEIEIDHSISTAVINQDMRSLKKWGDDNKTTFDPEKCPQWSSLKNVILSMHLASFSMEKNLVSLMIPPLLASKSINGCSGGNGRQTSP